MRIPKAASPSRMDESKPAPLVLIRDLRREGDDGRRLQRAVQRGKAVRVRRGIYASAEEWSSASADARYLIRVRSAVLAARSELVLSHYSAAAIWGYPMVGQWPQEVHVLVGSGSNRRSKNGIIRHAESFEESDLALVNSMVVTSPARTLVDLARVAPFAQAVAAMDSALRRDVHGADEQAADKSGAVSRLELESVLDTMGGVRGCSRAHAAIRFADSRAESAGESLSRVQFSRLGFAAPELQVRFDDHAGRIGICDFYWPDQDVVGEFDGFVKYERADYRQGRTPAQVVFDEKRREDRFRRVVRGFARWVWSDLHSDEGFARILMDAGLPRRAGR